LWKKMWFTILVTTNATTLNIKKEAEKYLPFIDELILSVEAIDKNLQQKISRTNVFVEWEKVFKNIKLYWKWTYLKVNIVITKDNLSQLFNILKYIFENELKILQ
jgi:wyosine [tRNA(Phe)-imidazoG37] synthetase (radical SAM superfamily)